MTAPDGWTFSEVDAAYRADALVKLATRYAHELVRTVQSVGPITEQVKFGVASGIGGAIRAIGEADPYRDMLCPCCPLCGVRALVIGSNVSTVFCPSDECEVFAWDAYEPAAENLKRQGEVTLTESRPDGDLGPGAGDGDLGAEGSAGDPQPPSVG